MNQMRRKQLRSYHVDCSRPGVYFITVSTSPRRNYFWLNPNEKYDTPECVQLNEIGKTAEKTLRQIPEHDSNINVDAYVIMPDHIHLLLRIHVPKTNNETCRKNISTVINQWKGIVTKTIGHSIWQKLFFDHVVRNDEDYENILRYMYNNPLKWYYEHHTELQ